MKFTITEEQEHRILLHINSVLEQNNVPDLTQDTKLREIDFGVSQDIKSRMEGNSYHLLNAGPVIEFDHNPAPRVILNKELRAKIAAENPGVENIEKKESIWQLMILECIIYAGWRETTITEKTNMNYITLAK